MSAPDVRAVAAPDMRAVAAALASLPMVGPKRLRVLVNELGVEQAWRTIRGECSPSPRLAALFAEHDMGRVWRAAATDD
ncbi:MAG: hypothetical protein ACO3KZ_07625, partial [Ilumatobacteraceae bacterium]